ncbi:MAG: penicillin acylase family protein [Thermoleophilaceae bacterium]
MTIVRDAGFGVPHVYGTTRSGTMFGLGYVGAEDRLFVIDVLRNSGRARLSSFAGGSPGNREVDRDQWRLAPYTEADLQRQYNLADDVYGAAGAGLQRDVTDYVAGINAYIAEARTSARESESGRPIAVMGPQTAYFNPQLLMDVDAHGRGGRRPSAGLGRCRARLAASLKAALAVDPAQLYRDEACEDYGKPSDQWCYDAVRHRPVGAINQPLTHWINRPTFQQLVEVQRRAPR